MTLTGAVNVCLVIVAVLCETCAVIIFRSSMQRARDANQRGRLLALSVFFNGTTVAAIGRASGNLWVVLGGLLLMIGSLLGFVLLLPGPKSGGDELGGGRPWTSELH